VASAANHTTRPGLLSRGGEVIITEISPGCVNADC